MRSLIFIFLILNSGCCNQKLVYQRLNAIETIIEHRFDKIRVYTEKLNEDKITKDEFNDLIKWRITIE